MREPSVRAISSSLIAVLLTGLWVSPAAAAESTVRLDVGLTDGANAAGVVGRLTGSVTGWNRVTGLDAITLDVPAAQRDTVLRHLKADPGVRFAEPGATVHADSPSVDITDYYADGPLLHPTSANYRWFSMAQIPSALSWTRGSSSVTVAVVDTGVSANPGLGSGRLSAGRDFVDGDADASDPDGHGTLMANLVAGKHTADQPSSTGICSACRILPVRVLSPRADRPAEGTSADVAAGIVWAADHGADIINLSLSTPAPSRLLSEAVQHAEERGALVVGSAGQTATTARQYPAALDTVLAVGSINEYGAPSIGSNRNSPEDRWIDVLAPDRAWVINRDGNREAARGTSAATALVSGTAALALSVQPKATAAEIRKAVTETAMSTVGHTPVEPHDARVLNAARVVHDLGNLEDARAPQFKSDLDLIDGAVINDDARSVKNVWLADDHGIDRMDLLVGGEVVDSTPAAPWARYLTLDPQDDYNGELTVTVRAVDYAGLHVDRTVKIRVDSIEPTASVTSPHPYQMVAGPIRVAVTATSPDVEHVLVNGERMTRTPGRDEWTATVTPERDAGGQYGYTFFVWDKAGNVIPLFQHVTYDPTGPTVRSISPAAGARVRGTFTSTLNSVDDPAGIAKADLWGNGTYIGRDTTAPYSLKVPTRTANGAMTLKWTVTDKLGNVSTHTRTVIADNRGPSLSITKAPKNRAKVTGTVKVYVKATDTSGIARVELLVGGKVVATDTKAGYLLTLNTRTQKKTMKVRVRAYDKLGNVTYTSIRTWQRG
ncbi:S8 family serine peptidase [Actinoplanes sp. NPDC049802]|uniref:S8 family serine peptidase n=1 Tax=Actinoplanes sp. NPDC049802 TaxID=3154742 RepID=UPI0033CBCFBA